MDLAEIWQEIAGRPSGKMAFRFYLQPLMAILLAARDGIGDARAARPAYFWALFADRAGRRALLRDGWHSIRKVFIAALIIDTVYQLFVLHGLRPVAGLLVAIALALIPYVLVRGPVNRVARVVIRTLRRRRSTA